MQKINLEKERVLLDRDITFFHFGRARKRIEKCIKFSRENKKDFYFFYFMAQKYILKENYLLAIEYLDKALLIKDDDGPSYNDKALCLAELKRYNQALECFNKGIKKNADYPLLYHNKGWLLNLLGRHKEAILCFKKAVELNEECVEAFYSMADSYAKINQIEIAKKYFKKVLKKIKGKCSLIYKETKRRLAELEKLNLKGS